MAFSIRCPTCRQKFPWNPTEGMPEFCPNADCESRIAHDRADDDIVMPFIRSSSRTKSIDQSYRDIEHSSEVRAEMAAEKLGVSVSEMSDLKVTDLKDAKRQGEVAAQMSVAAEQRLASQTTSKVGFQGNGAGYAADIATGAVVVNGKITQGIAPRAGASAMATVQRLMGR